MKIRKTISTSIDVDGEGRSLQKFEATAIIISNRLDTDQATGQGAQDAIYWGFNGEYAHQLHAGQTTPLIPIARLSDVSIRAEIGQTRKVYFSYFVED